MTSPQRPAHVASMQPLAIVFTLLWFGTCGHAAIWGGAPERLAAAALFFAAPLSWALAPVLSAWLGAWNGGLLTIDLMLLAALLAIALASTRFWPMLMTSMHGVTVLGHGAKALAPDIIPAAYFALVAFWSFPMQLLLSVAVVRHRRRVARYGRDPAWSRALAKAGDAFGRGVDQ